MTTETLTLGSPRGRASGPAWEVGAGMSVSVDDGCALRSLDERFRRCVTCPLERCWMEHSISDRTRAARLVRRLGGVPPKF